MTRGLNLPDVVAELTAACDAYEAALASNDLEAMDSLFWDSPETLRYGVGENLYGIAEIRQFRKARPGGSPERTVTRRVITTYGADMGTCNLEFRRVGGSLAGRQSQTWLKTNDGWKVVAAYVSLIGTSS